jgi:NADPH:quinone reductase
MRAAWYERKGPAREVLVVGEASEPVPAPGEVRVRLAVSGINPGDTKKRDDWLASPMPYPRIIPHSDGAGIIDTVGDDVPPTRIGERVWVYGAQSYRPFGTAAEWVAVPRERAVALPDGVDFATGACLGISARTAHRCVFADGPVAGRKVLVAGGAGSVGHAAVALASWGGAMVIATVGSPVQADMVQHAGAAVVLDRHRQDLADAILAATGGAGVDRIVEVALGANIALDEQVIANGGTIVAYASDADPEPRLPFWPLLFKNVVLRLVGSDDLPAIAEQAAVTDITSCLAQGQLRPVVAHRLPLARIAEAHELVEQGGPAGHVLLDIGTDVAG